MTAEPETPEPEEVPAGAEPELGTSISVRAERGARMTPSEAVRDMRITLPARGNRKLRDLIERVNRDTELKALWHAANVNAVTPPPDQRPLMGAHPDRHEHRPEAPARAAPGRAWSRAWWPTTA